MSIPLLDTLNIPTGILTSTTSELLLARDTDGDVKLFNGASYLRGTGTVNRVVKFTGVNSLGDSTIIDNSTVGIGAQSSFVGFLINSSSPLALSVSTSKYGVFQNTTVPSNTTVEYVGFSNYLFTPSGLSLSDYVHFRSIQQNLLGSITNQTGFEATVGMVSATNNYGFRGRINAGTGRWNLYMDGNASNYMAGFLRIGSSGTPESSLNIAGASGSPVLKFTRTNPLAQGGIGFIGFGKEGDYTAGFGSFYGPGSTSASDLRFYTGSPSTHPSTITERMRIDVQGSVMINTTSNTGERLQVNGNIKQTSVTNNLLFANSNGVLTAYANTASIALGTGTGGYIVRYSGTGVTQNIGNSALFQNGSNIGLGKTNPGYTFDVNGDIGVSGTLSVYSGASSVSIVSSIQGIISTYTNHAIHSLGANFFVIGRSSIFTTGAGVGYKAQIDSGTTGGKGLFVNGDIYSTATITSFSDIRLKGELEKIENAIDKIKKISGYTYLFNDKRTLGLISQEVKNIAPEAIEEKGGYMTLNYQGFSAVIVEAIKELSNEIQKLKEKCQ